MVARGTGYDVARAPAAFPPGSSWICARPTASDGHPDARCDGVSPGRIRPRTGRDLPCFCCHHCRRRSVGARVRIGRVRFLRKPLRPKSCWPACRTTSRGALLRAPVRPCFVLKRAASRTGKSDRRRTLVDISTRLTGDLSVSELYTAGASRSSRVGSVALFGGARESRRQDGHCRRRLRKPQVASPHGAA